MVVKSFCRKNDYLPLKQLGDNLYEICFDSEILMNDILDENGNKIGEEESDLYIYASETAYFKPSIEYIKNLILDYYNKKIDTKILNGFRWKNMPVWLSSENQFNYKAAYDLAIQTSGQSLPVTFKFGNDNNPTYYTFESLEDFTDFYTNAITYINNCLSEGWTKKDSINWNDYTITE